VLEPPAYIGAAPHPTVRLRLAAATVQEPAYVGAAPYPTTRLRFTPGDAASSAAILGLAVARGATAVNPGSIAYVHASSSACRTATTLATDGAAVLSGTVLGRALCAAAAASALALAASTAALGTTSYDAAAAAAATLGLHEAVGASSYAAAATSAVF
jgi:hypothetical protein